jgi:hypothetical protein
MRDITVAGKALTVSWFTGVVVSASKNTETRVSGGGGGGYADQHGGYRQPVTISSTTIVHDRFALVDANGDERAFHLTGFDAALRDSNMVTVFGALPRGATSGGAYVALYNHTNGSVSYGPEGALQLVGPSRVQYGFWGAGALVASYFITQLQRQKLDQFFGFILAVVLVVGLASAIFAAHSMARGRAFESSNDFQQLLRDVHQHIERAAVR